MTKEWQEKLGQYGETKFGQKVLDGDLTDADLNGIPEGAKLLLQALKALTDMVEVQDLIMPKSNQQDWS